MATTLNVTNPFGATVIGDGANPRIFTAMATEVISGGAFVQISGATGDVGSTVSSYDTPDLKVILAINPKLCNGIALQNTASGTALSVATRGDYLIYAGGIVSGGALVQHNASGAVANLSSLGSTSVGALEPSPIGRAKTTSASGTANFALIGLNI